MSLAITSLVEAYEHLTAACKRHIVDATELDSSVQSRARHMDVSRDLKALDVRLARQLRLAGCMGAAAQRLLDQADAQEAADVKVFREIKARLN